MSGEFKVLASITSRLRDAQYNPERYDIPTLLEEAAVEIEALNRTFGYVGVIDNVHAWPKEDS